MVLQPMIETEDTEGKMTSAVAGDRSVGPGEANREGIAIGELRQLVEGSLLYWTY